MLFNSWLFWAFFISLYLVYLRLGRRGQNLLCLVGSYAFYAAWDWRFLGLMLLSTVVDYWVAQGISATSSKRRRRGLLVASLVTNLGLLGFFKYYDFFSESLRVVLEQMGVTADPMLLNVILPVGISFYTFQTLSYTIDVYRGTTKAAKNPLDFALYVSFFPQLIAGPIERSSRLLPQIQNPRRLTHEHLRRGVWLIVYGLFMKVAVADNLSVYADGLFGEPSPEGLAVWMRVLAFMFQIYGDFAGYSAIARGVASLMGFSLMVNFNAPYLSTSPSEFWKRWHISLSSWLRDYLYIPLGGSRGGFRSSCRNLMITMLLGGLWHGAGWNFILWGVYHGLLLVVYRVLARFFGRDTDRKTDRKTDRETGRKTVGLGWWIVGSFKKLCGLVIFFVLTLYGWLLFRCESLAEVLDQTRAGFGFGAEWTAKDQMVLQTILVLITPVVVLDLCIYRFGGNDFMSRAPGLVRWPMYLVMLAWIYLIGVRGGGEFIYFQF